MTDDLETRLRASLRERARDVEPTPALWRQVQRRTARRRVVPLLVWTAAGVAAAVTAFAVVPGLVERMDEGFVIDPAQSPSATTSPGEVAPGPVAAAPLTHYVAVVDGRLVLRDLEGSEQMLWQDELGDAALALRPGSTVDDLVVAVAVRSGDQLDLYLVESRARGRESVIRTISGARLPAGSSDAVPSPVWSPDGGTVAWAPVREGNLDLDLLDVEPLLAGGQLQEQQVAITLEGDPARVRLQDWVASRADARLFFTADGQLLELELQRGDDGWSRGALRATGDDRYVVDVATGADGTRYRLLAGVGGGSGDAEDAGLALEFGDELIPFPDLPTASPADVWMTAVEGGAIVGRGDDARIVHRDPEGNSPHAPLTGVSYAAWVPVAGAAGEVPKGAPPAEPTEDTTDAPRADGPLSESGVTPYVAVDGSGRVAVHTGDGGEGEVIIDEQLWAPEAAVSVTDVAVRPGSTAGEVSGVVLLATEGGPELAWFRAAAGETATSRMEGPYGLGPAADDPRDAPTFSPDGRHLAWVEPDDAGGWTLRTLGVDEDGPTDDDAGFGLDGSGVETVRLVDWRWTSVDEAAGTAAGELVLTASDGRLHYAQIERQGDGALAVGLGPDLSGEPAELPALDAGWRGDDMVALLSTDAGPAVRDGSSETLVPFGSDVDPRDLDLDVLARVAVVTNRATGEAFVVDRAGGVAPLEADAATTHGFDPVR